MRKLSTFLLTAATTGALIVSALAVTATPAAADSWGHRDYGRYDRHERYDRYDRRDRGRYEGRGYGYGYGYGGYDRYRRDEHRYGDRDGYRRWR